MKKKVYKNYDKKKIKEQRKEDRRLLRDQFKIQENVHTKLIMVVVFMCAFGALMVYSASAYNCSQSKIYGYDGFYFVKKHLVYMVAGLGVIFISQFVGIVRAVEKCAFLIYGGALLTVFLLLSSFGVSSHGATRWINLGGGIQFQPAEVMKIGVIVMLAFMAKNYSKSLSKLNLMLYMWFVGLAPAFLVMKFSSDLSSAVIIGAITIGITFIVTRQVALHLTLIGLGGTITGLYLWNFSQHLPTPEELEEQSYRVGRIAAWLAPERYAKQGYQVMNSLYAIGSGGWLGKGLGKSVMKLKYIPEAHNDMIFAIICEELGIFGAILLIILFVYMVFLMLRISINAESLYESVLVMGVLIHIASQTFINMAVAVNLFPNTGVPLPFISYGGTSLLCNLGEIALVVGISKKHFIRRGQRTVYEEKMKGEE